VTFNQRVHHGLASYESLINQSNWTIGQIPSDLIQELNGA
jgi:hypothetical protein